MSTAAAAPEYRRQAGTGVADTGEARNVAAGPAAISVVIPVWNRPSLLAEAVASVFAQTLPPLEIIVVDDGSDEPVEAAALRVQALGLSGAGARPASGALLRVITLAHAGFPGRARNAGVAEARGSLIAFLDSDDLMYPRRLEREAALLRDHPGIRLVHARERWMRNGREVSQAGQAHARSGDIFADALKKCTIGPSTVLMEKALFLESGGFREDIEVAEDYEFWLRITAREQVGYVDEPLVEKRAGGWGQLSEKYGMIERFRIEALDALVRGDALPAGRLPLARAELARKLRIWAAGARKRGRSAEADELERRAAELGTDAAPC